MWGCCCLFSSAHSRGADSSAFSQLSTDFSLNENRVYVEKMKITKGQPKTRIEMRTFIKQELIRNFSVCCPATSQVDHILDTFLKPAVESALGIDGASAVSDRQMNPEDDSEGCYVTISTNYEWCGGKAGFITQGDFQVTCCGVGDLSDFISFEKSRSAGCCLVGGVWGMNHANVAAAPRLCCCLIR